MNIHESTDLSAGELQTWFNPLVLPLCGGEDAETVCLFLSTLIYRDFTTDSVMIWADADVEGLAAALCGFGRKRYRRIRDNFVKRGMIEYVRPKAWKLNHARIGRLTFQKLNEE